MKTMRNKIMMCMILAVMFVMMLGMGSVWATGDTWATKASMPTERFDLGTAEANGKIYAIGGRNNNYQTTNEEYDVSQNTWSTKTGLTTARFNFGITSLNNKVYVIGGYLVGSGQTNTVIEYDPATNSWTSKANMPTTREGLGVVAVNGKIYAIGGTNSNTVIKTVEEYDPATNTWTSKADMLTARHGFGVATANGKIYAIGGHTGSAFLNTVEEYDPITNTWTSKTSMSTSRVHLGAATLNNIVYAIGGLDSNGNASNITEAYNPVTNSWVTRTNMSTAREDLGVAAASGKIYTIGGKLTTYVSTVEEYTPPVSIPDAPANLTAQVSGTQVNLSWTGVTSATSYNVKRSLTTGGSYTTLTNVTGTTYTDTTVTSGNTYYYVVTAANEAGESGNSNEASITLSPSAPVLSGIWSSGKVSLSWINPTGATYFRVKRATVSGGPYSPLQDNYYATTYDDTTVVNGDTYYYIVYAVNSGGESVASNEVCMTLQGNRAILEITMTNGKIKEYDMTIAQIDAFINWYDNRANGTGKSYYVIRKTNNIKPFLGRRDYIIFDKILDFEVKDYNDIE